MRKEDLERWMKLAMRRHYRQLYTQIKDRPDRLLLLSTHELQLQKFVKQATDDSSFREMFGIYMEEMITGGSYEQLAEKLESNRKEWEKRADYVASEYPSAEMFVLTGCFYLETDQRKMLKQFMAVHLSIHALDVYPAMIQALRNDNTRSCADVLFSEILELPTQQLT